MKCPRCHQHVHLLSLASISSSHHARCSNCEHKYKVVLPRFFTIYLVMAAFPAAIIGNDFSHFASGVFLFIALLLYNILCTYMAIDEER